MTLLLRVCCCVAVCLSRREWYCVSAMCVDVSLGVVLVSPVWFSPVGGKGCHFWFCVRHHPLYVTPPRLCVWTVRRPDAATTELLRSRLSSLPATLPSPNRTPARISSPLFRFLEREVSAATKLLARVRSDVEACLRVCTGEEKSSNRVRGFLSDFSKGEFCCCPLSLTALGRVGAFFVPFLLPHGCRVGAVRVRLRLCTCGSGAQAVPFVFAAFAREALA